MDILQCLQKYGQRLDSEIAEETGVALARVRERFALLTGTGDVRGLSLNSQLRAGQRRCPNLSEADIRGRIVDEAHRSHHHGKSVNISTRTLLSPSRHCYVRQVRAVCFGAALPSIKIARPSPGRQISSRSALSRAAPAGAPFPHSPPYQNRARADPKRRRRRTGSPDPTPGRAGWGLTKHNAEGASTPRQRRDVFIIQ